ncbi:autotransporter domain-containing protein [Usitatibacter palustris]|uniref:Esterase EstP n=1 Tax=Usitatibacter palustris TaxID=2732487 RepID=A0A6M4H4R5_9PROT|nr:autotransporter domain-containing protein [Usitatibacter palustris]QJR14165.1 Esterase EstP [Usitatibacter palustris]
MTKKNRVLPALLLSLFAGVGATTAQAQQFSNVYVFGDSLSDTGYYRPFLTSIGVPSALVSTLGRFTTNPGPIWAELIAQQYGVGALPSNVAGGTVYAQGGARVALPSASTPTGGAQRPVSTQVTEFLAASGGAADPNALYTVWAGANDIFQNLAALQAGAITADQLSANIQAAAAAEAGQIARLRAAGARYIMVFNLPNIGATPQFAGAGPVVQGQVTALSAGFNTALFAGLAGLQATGLRVIPVDTFALITEIMANPTAYGFTNTTGVACAPFPPFATTPSSQFCSGANLVAPNADQTYVFADGVHPTTASHRITADFVKSLLNGPVQMTLLPESALGARNAHVRSLRDGITTGQAAAQGQWTIFGSAVDGEYDIDPSRGVVGVGNDVRAVTGGVTVRASETLTLGLAAGRNEAKASFGNSAGNYRTRENAISVLGGVRLDGLFFDAALTYGDIEWNDIRRQFNIGNVVRTTTASTEGTNTSAYVGGGYDFQLDKFSIGPVASVMIQNVDMNGFEETGAGSANLRYGAFKRRSEVWSAGGRASITLGRWTPWVRVTVDKERRDDERFMSATPVSMATNNGYDLPGYQPDTSFITSNVGVTGQFSWGALGIAYYNVAKREGQSEEGFTASVAIRF